MWGKGILKGFVITMKNMLRGPITVQYPEERLELPERARWTVVPRRNDDGSPKCTACMICIRECPDHVLKLDVEKNEDGSKTIVTYGYEMGACMMCGLCVEACPFSAIEMSHEYELATPDFGDLYRVLIENELAAAPKREKKEPAADAAADKPKEGDVA